MCYHVSTPSKAKLVQELPEYKINIDFDPIYHVSGFTRPFLPITTNANLRIVETGRWKLLPFWVKNEEGAKKHTAITHNARSEVIFETSTFKPYIEKYRGLLWVDGFFEPHKTETGSSENRYIYLPEKRIFSLGIVISPWLNADTKETINTFSILTTPASPFMEKIHNEKKRMPLIIPPYDREGWLLAKGKDEIQSFFKPFDGLLQAHKTYRVTADRTGLTNRPDIQDEIS